MKKYAYKNSLISKKQLRQIIAWSFTTYTSMQGCALADELKRLGFQYASQAGISISIEDLRIPFVKNVMMEKANQEIVDSEKLYLKGRITSVERFQKIIDTWGLASDALKTQIIYFFKNYDPLNSVYIMAFSGARGNLSQVRQLVGMRGLMSDPSGEILNLPIKNNFREGLTITDYLMSGYGARKGIVDTALKTANSGYLTRRLIDVSQDILIREKDCLTRYSILFTISSDQFKPNSVILEKLIGCVLSKSIFNFETQKIIAKAGTQITPDLIKICRKRKINQFYLRSSLTCNLYRAICQNCYGWDLANERLVDIGEAIGILAGQSIGEPGTQLTMRTFHTGGVFTTKARQQILSPIPGIFQFSKLLKTVRIRTSRGEDVSLTKIPGSVIIIPDENSAELSRIKLPSNTIVFPKHQQYIFKGNVVGERIDTNRQLKAEIKPILSDEDGEIIVPKLKKRVNLINNNQLIWILFGKLFYSPINAFLNFYSDCKIHSHNSISRSKLIAQHEGYLVFSNAEKYLERQLLKLTDFKYCFDNLQVKKLETDVKNKTHLLHFPASKYLISINKNTSHSYLSRSRDGQIGLLLTNKFKTLVGGILFYNIQNLINENGLSNATDYFSYDSNLNDYVNPIQYMTLAWLEKEIHKVDFEPHSLFVEHGDFISEGFEIAPKLFSKTSGLVRVEQNLDSVKSISINSGLLYEGNEFKNIKKEIYYPGEILFSNLFIENLAICESLGEDQILVRPFYIYEIAKSRSLDIQNTNFKNNSSSFKLNSKKLYVYLSGQAIQTKDNLDLIDEMLLINNRSYGTSDVNIEFVNVNHRNNLTLQFTERLQFSNYVTPDLKYKNMQFCSLIQNDQFLSRYATIGYVESVTTASLEIVKIKIQQQVSRQILVIPNTNCTVASKNQLPDKKLNDLVLHSPYTNQIGKIILENDQNFIIQHGQPYFFPRCKDKNISVSPQLQYKVLPGNFFKSYNLISQQISVKHYKMTQVCSQTTGFNYFNSRMSTGRSATFSQIFFKQNGRLYACITPSFYNKFSINQEQMLFGFQKLVNPRISQPSVSALAKTEKIRDFWVRPKRRTIMIKSKQSSRFPYQLGLITFEEQPFCKSSKAVGLYSITEDYFEEQTNSLFCKNNDFVEAGVTIGLLNLEKEITGDIVQGLPRIEEVLEARKKNLGSKNIPASQRKSLLCYASSLNPSFEFQKLGTPTNERDKVNPHKLLKIYFNYYGLTKQFLCQKKKVIRSGCLINNYDGSYKSFKKVQLFILNSVQSIYNSQGVGINNKHLEVIIRQMTTKVLVTSEGSAPLLRREIVDLYHIKYINKTVQSQMKEPACYVPVLFGITKSALNNPSFVSAASFQETTRVLTKAAIEGKIDWLRGLKENIVTGRLIPAGTGSPNYYNAFRQKKTTSKPRLLLAKQRN